MYTILVSLGVTTFVVVLSLLFSVPLTWTTLPGMAFGVLAFVWINRRVAKRVEAVTAAADAELNGLQQLAQRQGGNTQTLIARKFEASVSVLKRGFLFRHWQLGVGTMLNARIGMLYFSQWMLVRKGGLAEAIPFLEASRVKNKWAAKLVAALWPAWAMLGVCYYRGRKDVDKATEVLEYAVGVSPKEGMLWSVYAWILHDAKRLDAAINVLARAKDAAPDDPRIVQNLTALQNKKKMKMKDYGEQWYQFGLERPKAAGTKAQMGHPRMKGRGGMRRR